MVNADVVNTNSNKQLIDTLRRSKLFRRYEQVFSEATGLPLTLRPVDYWQLEHQGKKQCSIRYHWHPPRARNQHGGIVCGLGDSEMMDLDRPATDLRFFVVFAVVQPPANE